MSTFPNAPRLLKGGLVQVDVTSGRVLQVIPLQYNPDTLTRTLAPQGMGEGAQRNDTLRLKGPAQETFKLDAELDSTDELEHPEANPDAVQWGVLPRLAALEALVYPDSSQILANQALASVGTLEIAPMEKPLLVFVWSASRVMPVRLSDLSITEEGFDPQLHPLRAKASLTLKVLTINDLGFDHRGGTLYLQYQQQKERWAGLTPGSLGALGLKGLP